MSYVPIEEAGIETFEYWIYKEYREKKEERNKHHVVLEVFSDPIIHQNISPLIIQIDPGAD